MVADLSNNRSSPEGAPALLLPIPFLEKQKCEEKPP